MLWKLLLLGVKGIVFFFFKCTFEMKTKVYGGGFALKYFRKGKRAIKQCGKGHAKCCIWKIGRWRLYS